MRHTTIPDEIAHAAVRGDAIVTRSLCQDFLAKRSRLDDIAPSRSNDPVIRAVFAALVELFALRRSLPAPAWCREVGPLDAPLFLVHASAAMPRLRAMCEAESPEPLKRRNIFAPANYLSFV